MLEQLQAKSRAEKLLLEALDDVELRSEASLTSGVSLGHLDYGRVVLVRELSSSGWAQLHEDEVWAGDLSDDSEAFPEVFVLVDGRPQGLQRFFRLFSKNLDTWLADGELALGTSMTSSLR